MSYWETPVYTVLNNQPACVEESLSYTYKYINSYGQIMVEQNAYDGFWDISDEGESLWYGHTWKYYPFKLIDSRLFELGAKELSADEVNAISPLPTSVQEKLQGDENWSVIAVQYLLRDNGDLNINYAEKESAYEGAITFNNVTLRLSEANQWRVTEFNGGTYTLNLSEEKGWDFRDDLDKLAIKKLAKEEYDAYKVRYLSLKEQKSKMFSMP